MCVNVFFSVFPHARALLIFCLFTNNYLLTQLNRRHSAHRCSSDVFPFQCILNSHVMAWHHMNQGIHALFFTENTVIESSLFNWKWCVCRQAKRVNFCAVCVRAIFFLFIHRTNETMKKNYSWGLFYMRWWIDCKTEILNHFRWN